MAITGPPCCDAISQIVLTQIQCAFSTGGIGLAAIAQIRQNALAEEIEIANNASYDIDPDVEIVHLNAVADITAITLTMPNLNYQYNGKRLVILPIVNISSLTLNVGGSGVFKGISKPLLLLQNVPVEYIVSKESESACWLRIK